MDYIITVNIHKKFLLLEITHHRIIMIQYKLEVLHYTSRVTVYRNSLRVKALKRSDYQLEGDSL